MTPSPHSNEVTIWPDADSMHDSDSGLTIEDVTFVSLIDAGTHGPPALIAPTRQNGQPVDARARVGDRVLYINTSLVPLFEIERKS